MKFIKLTDYDGNETFVNVYHIARIVSDKKLTTIFMIGEKSSFKTKISLESVLKIINE